MSIWSAVAKSKIKTNKLFCFARNFSSMPSTNWVRPMNGPGRIRKRRYKIVFTVVHYSLSVATREVWQRYAFAQINRAWASVLP